MIKAVLVTSCKGGIGKSTVAANLAAALAMAGSKVLAVDCDIHSRNLDLVMGFESLSMFSLLDVVRQSVSLEKAMVRDDSLSSLSFLAAPVTGCEELNTECFSKLFDDIRRQEFEYVIIDAPADDSKAIELASSVSDEALIICSHMPASIRAAEQTAVLLNSLGVKNQKLIINSFDAEGVINDARTGIIEMIDLSRLMLIGIIPYDRELLISQESGKLINTLKNNNARKAFENIAARLCGKQLPLFDGFTGKLYKKIAENKTY